MRRFVLLVVILLGVMASASAAAAQPITGSGWSWVLPVSMPHQTVDFVSPTEAWSFGVSSRVLLHTADGGVTWQASLSRAAWASDFVDGSHAWEVGWMQTSTDSEAPGAGAVWRTADGGATWKLATIPGAASLTGVSFADALHGCVIGSGGIVARTSDGGATWALSQPAAALVLLDVQMVDATHVLAVGARTAPEGDAGAVYASSDGGATWTQQLAYQPEDVTEIAMADATAGWCAARGTVLHTADGGATWTSTNPAPALDMQWSLPATVGDGSHAWVVGWPLYGDFGLHIYATDDAGASWHEQSAGALPATSVTQLCPLSEDDVLAFSGVGDEWASGDGGQTWSQLVTGSQQWTQGLSFVSATEGWAATPYSSEGEIRHTADGGDTWDGADLPLEPGTDRSFDPQDVRFVDGERGWAVGSGFAGGALAATSDGGTTWTLQDIPKPAGYEYEVSLNTLDFANAQNGWVAGYDGVILRTTDGGATWRLRRGLDGEFSASWASVAAISGARCCVAGTTGRRGVIASTRDGGATWRLLKPAAATRSGIQAICFADSLNGWATGANGLVLRTHDGGATWQSAGRPILSAAGRAISFSDAKHGWILADNGLWRTADGGTTWRLKDVPCPSAECLSAPTASAAYVGGEQGVTKTTTAGVSPTDRTPPVTAVTRPTSVWHNHAVRLRFTVREAESGYLFTFCDVTGLGTYGAYGALRVDPGSGMWEGLHTFTVGSMDVAGNGGPTRSFKLGFDTRHPNTYALKNVTVASGGVARLPFKIKDPKPGCGSARTWLTVFNRNGKVLKSVPWGARKTNVNLSGSYRCTLPAGVYGWLVAAVDIAGNKTDTAYYSLLQVTSARGAASGGDVAGGLSASQADDAWTPPELDAVAKVRR